MGETGRARLTKKGLGRKCLFIHGLGGSGHKEWAPQNAIIASIPVRVDTDVTQNGCSCHDDFNVDRTTGQGGHCQHSHGLEWCSIDKSKPCIRDIHGSSQVVPPAKLPKLSGYLKFPSSDSGRRRRSAAIKEFDRLAVGGKLLDGEWDHSDQRIDGKCTERLVWLEIRMGDSVEHKVRELCARYPKYLGKLRGPFEDGSKKSECDQLLSKVTDEVDYAVHARGAAALDSNGAFMGFREISPQGEYNYWGGTVHSVLMEKSDCNEIWLYAHPNAEGNSPSLPTPQKALVNMMETFEYDPCNPDSTRVIAHSFGNLISALTCTADMYRVPGPNGDKGDCLYGPGKRQVNNKIVNDGCACPQWLNNAGPLGGSGLIDGASNLQELAASIGNTPMGDIEEAVENFAILSGQYNVDRNGSVYKCSNHPEEFDPAVCRGDDPVAPTPGSGITFSGFSSGAISIFAKFTTPTGSNRVTGDMPTTANMYIDGGICGYDGLGPFRAPLAYKAHHGSIMMNHILAKMKTPAMKAIYPDSSFFHPVTGEKMENHDGCVEYESCTMRDVVNSHAKDYAASWKTADGSSFEKRFYKGQLNHADVIGRTGDHCCGPETYTSHDGSTVQLFANDYSNNDDCKICRNWAIPLPSPGSNSSESDEDCTSRGCGPEGSCNTETGVCKCANPGWGGKFCEFAPLTWAEDRHGNPTPAAVQARIECCHVQRYDTCPMRFLTRTTRMPVQVAPGGAIGRQAWCDATGGGKRHFFSKNNGGCHKDATCMQQIASIHTSCKCNYGYAGNGRTCEKIGICTVNHGGCDTDGRATCTEVGHMQANCSCNKGYINHPVDGKPFGAVCRMDCNINNGGCHPNATCEQQRRGLTACKCNEGYAGSGVGLETAADKPSCEVVDPCKDRSHVCHLNAQCAFVAPGQSNCSCNSGFRGNGVNCLAIDACAAPGLDSDCDEDAKCITTGPGTFKCSCNAGWHGDGKMCEEPEVGTSCTNDCSGRGHCDIFGTCQCDPGYEGDDCSMQKGAHGKCPDNCGHHGLCVGGDRCVCDPAWRGPACKTMKGFALQLFGGSQYLKIGGEGNGPAFAPMSQFTVSLWALRASDVDGHVHTLLASDSQHSAGSVWIGFFRDDLMVNVAGCHPSSQSFKLPEAAVAARQWHLYGITFSALDRKVSLYVDHKLVQTHTYESAHVNATLSGSVSGAMTVGDVVSYGGRHSAPFEGAVDDLQVWDTCRTKAQMEAKRSVVSKRLHLIGYWPMDEGHGNVTRDLSGHGRPARLVYASDQVHDNAEWVHHPLPSLALRAGIIPAHAPRQDEYSAQHQTVILGRRTGPKPQDRSVNRQNLRRPDRKCNPTTGEGCARCCTSGNLPKYSEKRDEDTTADTPSEQGTGGQTSTSKVILKQYGCLVQGGSWLCDGKYFCHALNDNEACCTSSPGNKTCVRTGRLGRLSYQLSEDGADSGPDDNFVLGVASVEEAAAATKTDDPCGGCGGHGTCDTTSGGRCVCEVGYAGKHCDMPSCNDENGIMPCSGNGYCDDETKICTCNPGYYELSCSRKFEEKCEGAGARLNCTVDECQCVTSNCMYGCSGHGLCHEDGRCTCDQGYSGLGCERNSLCANSCSGHGKCKKDNRDTPLLYRGNKYFGTCACADMYSGDDCSVPDNQMVGSR